MVIFIVWIAFNVSQQKKKLESHKKVCKSEDFCYVIISFEDTKILKSNQYQKSDKTFIQILSV